MMEDLDSFEGDKWKHDSNFAEYVSSYNNLGEEEKKTQDKNRNHFFELC